MWAKSGDEVSANHKRIVVGTRAMRSSQKVEEANNRLAYSRTVEVVTHANWKLPFKGQSYLLFICLDRSIFVDKFHLVMIGL